MTERLDSVHRYLDEVKRTVDSLEPQLEPFVECLLDAYKANKTVFLIGNGGSASAASHFGQDLCKAATMDVKGGKKFRALPLTDNTSYITALANDDGYENIFTEQLSNFAQPGDLVVAISGSGNSKNILKAIEFAKSNRMVTAGITGFEGGQLGKMADIHINVASNDIGLAEAVHSVLFHLTISELRPRIAALHEAVPASNAASR